MASRRLRRCTTLLASAALLAVGAGCEPTEPPPPPPVLVVSAFDDLPDADPGDGVCEATVGSADCTLRAAVEEANALGAADLVLGDHEYQITSPLVVTGSLRVNFEAPQRTGVVGSGGARHVLHVAAGGTLVLEGVYTYLDLVVDGALVARRSFIGNEWGTALTVGVGGAAVVQHSTVGTLHGSTDGAIVNHGTLMVDYATVGGSLFVRLSALDLGELVTMPGADTSVRGSWLASGCAGDSPTSMGYNADAGTTCGLDGTGDLDGASPVRPPSVPSTGLAPGELIDAIPVGEIGCGTAFTYDVDSSPRPADGDGDGVAACDIGSNERQAP
jgi:hypothetical protein